MYSTDTYRNIVLPPVSREKREQTSSDVTLLTLSVCIGARHQCASQLHVRGTILHPSPARRGKWIAFAGYTWLRDGRSKPEYDIHLYDATNSVYYDDESVLLVLDLAIHEALGRYAADLVTGELARAGG